MKNVFHILKKNLLFEDFFWIYLRCRNITGYRLFYMKYIPNTECMNVVMSFPSVALLPRAGDVRSQTKWRACEYS